MFTSWQEDLRQQPTARASLRFCVSFRDDMMNYSPSPKNPGQGRGVPHASPFRYIWRLGFSGLQLEGKSSFDSGVVYPLRTVCNMESGLASRDAPSFAGADDPPFHQTAALKTTVSSMVDSVGSLLVRTAGPPPPSALLAPPKPPAPPPGGEMGYWARARAAPAPAPALAKSAQKARSDLLSPQTLSPWVMPAVEKVSTSGSLPQHEAQLLGRLLQGLEESSLSVHDVTSVLELDLKRPGYGDSLAQTMASPDREAPKEVAPRKEEEAEAPASAACARCRVLERQMKALAQALAGRVIVEGRAIHAWVPASSTGLPFPRME
eukprot:s3842_g3.t1